MPALVALMAVVEAQECLHSHSRQLLQQQH
jgi:hypothetical protein